MSQHSNFKDLSLKIKLEINNASNILLHCHPYPDPDSVCSVLAMQSVLGQMGKNVTVIQGDTDIPTNLCELKNISLIKQQDWTQIDTTAFDLFIILDSSSLSQITQKVDVVLPVTMRTVVIDHHNTNEHFGDINLVEETYASTTQILYDLFTLWEVSISKDLALYLFLGMFADTGGFRYFNTTPEVFQTAHELVRIQPDYHEALFSMDNNKSAVELEMVGLALMSLEKYYSDKIVFSIIPYYEVHKRNLTKEQAMEGLIANTLRSVKGWQVVASLVEAEPNIVTISLRTRDELRYDMSLIARAVGAKGGGHRGAAGTTVYQSIDQAKVELLEKLLLNYPDLA